MLVQSHNIYNAFTSISQNVFATVYINKCGELNFLCRDMPYFKGMVIHETITLILFG